MGVCLEKRLNAERAYKISGGTDILDCSLMLVKAFSERW